MIKNNADLQVACLSIKTSLLKWKFNNLKKINCFEAILI